MTIHRRRLLQFVAASAAVPVLALRAWAQTYPSRPVRLVVGFPPGGPTDITARLIAQWLTDRLGQQFVIEHRPGAGSNLAVASVVASPPDGYTLLLAVTANAINASLYKDLRFDFIRDMAPVASLIRYPMLMVVNPAVPARTVPEFIAYAKANPGKLNFGSGSIGSPFHVGGELFKMLTGTDMQHVAYRGSALMLTDLISGQVQVAFDAFSSSIQHVRTGTLRALAITGERRSSLVPDIPALSEFIPGYEASTWHGVVAPKGTPAEIVDRLNHAINAGLSDPALRARFADLGADIFPLSPAGFGKFIAEETDKWGKVVRFSGAAVN